MKPNLSFIYPLVGFGLGLVQGPNSTYIRGMILFIIELAYLQKIKNIKTNNSLQELYFDLCKYGQKKRLWHSHFSLKNVARSNMAKKIGFPANCFSTHGGFLKFYTYVKILINNYFAKFRH